ncbi:peptide deformylase [Rhizobiaceae bacterium]|nr:peptide deformylase [Rhizobiaceae bacterium]
MAILPIVTIPDPVLRRVSAPVERIDDALLRFVENLKETMYDAPGIGIAAVQVGEPRRIFVIDCAEREEHPRGEESAEPKRNPMVFINPEIVATTDARNVYDEGCLSIPDYYAEVERPAGCTLRFLGLDGDMHQIEADGILATCVQHEFDHLEGKLFIDMVSKLKRDMVVRKFTKLAKANGTTFVG